MTSKCNYVLGIASLLTLSSSTLVAQVAMPGEVPLKNWAAPLYWQPTPSERAIAKKGAAQFSLSPNATSNAALVFVAVSPCRLVDTRGAGAGFIGSTPFNGPYIPAGGTATFPLQSTIETQTTAPSPCGTIPAIAQAYSLNLTVVPHPYNTPVNYVTLWPDNGSPIPTVSTLNDQQGTLVANSAIVPAGTNFGGIKVFAYGSADVVIDMNGFYAAPTDGQYNTALGAGSLLSNNSGINNTAVGGLALETNTSGRNNTATGAFALQVNTTGSQNTASGQGALAGNTTGSNNTATGTEALSNNSTGTNNTANGAAALGNNIVGSDNTASGQDALGGNSSGSYNVAYGSNALAHSSTGSSNVAIGYNAAVSVSGAGSDNIHIGNGGSTNDNAVIRIGTQYVQTNTSIAGIYGGTPNVSNLLVCVDASGTLGTTGCTNTPSSQRFKDHIADMGDTSSKLLQLRPVTFLYKPEYDDGSHSLQYGLIAEEVAKLYPEMVGYDKDGQPNSVKYQSLAPMLLNEVQKLAAQNRSLEDRLAALEALLSDKPAAAKTGGAQ